MAVSVTFSDSTGTYLGQSSAFIQNATAAWDMWAAVLGPTAGTIDLILNIAAGPSTLGASGAASVQVDVGTVGPNTIYESGVAYELRTGLDPNGASSDCQITLYDGYIQQYGWVDPLDGTPVPAGKNSLVDVVACMIGHLLGMDGILNPTTYAIQANRESVFDSLVTVSTGKPFFSGAHSVAVYGGDVPLTEGSYTHFGNASPGAGQDLIPDLMNGVEFDSRRYTVSALDTALMSDLGLSTILSDTLIGSANADTMFGGRGNDVIEGRAGNDTLSGGAGIDLARYTGNRSAYTVQYNGGGFWSVSGPEGTDSISTIERLAFADQNISIRLPTVFDFSGDGNSDILFQNNDGTVAVWLQQGLTFTGADAVGSNPGTSWAVKGAADFDGDANGDILLQKTDGQVAVWLMDGLAVRAADAVHANAGSVWHVIGTGDFNNDLKFDILLQHDNGQVAVWLMNGLDLVGGDAIAASATGGWQIKGVGDFNGDAKSDILLQNTDGRVAVWMMNGLSVVGADIVHASAGTQWKVKGTGDFNSDGKSDILFQNNTTSQVAIWLMNGLDLVGGDAVAASAAGGWVVKGAEDLNGNGSADILLQNANGTVAAWLMSGLTVTAASAIGANPGSAWNVIAPTG